MNKIEGRKDINKEPFHSLLSPGWIIPVAIFTSLAIAGPLAGMIFYQRNQRKKGILTALITFIIGIIVLFTCFFWKIEWYWVALLLSLFHMSTGVLLYLFTKKTIVKDKIKQVVRNEYSGYQREITGALGGFIASLIIGPLAIINYMIITDRLFSTYMPIIFTDESALGWLYYYGFLCSIAGIVGGAIIAKVKPKITVFQTFYYAIIYYWSFLTLTFWLQILVGLPSFNARAATGKSTYDVIAPLAIYLFLFGVLWALCLMFYSSSVIKKRERLWRLIHIPLVNLAAVIVFSITFGFGSEIFLFLGQHYERHARGDESLLYYEYGLMKAPQKKAASYLQYRIALLNYKAGEVYKATNCFRRVITKYNANNELVKKANYFLKRLSRIEKKERVVLPGVDTRTEYKGSYCVPNSLAFVMKYWGKNVSPRTIGKTITGLSRGTFIVDQTWFALKEGFCHEFLPLAEADDIKKFIDAGFPVLVYVPAHVFVIFGYDETLSTFVTYDVATHDVWVEYIQRDFIKAWKKQAATLAVVYPPEKKSDIPSLQYKKLYHLSDQYLHYQLHFFDTLSSGFSIAHLKKAAGENGDFFFPIVTLYMDYPGLRDEITEQYKIKKISNAIFSFFSSNFDEGTHLWGQYHNEDWALPDWALNYGISFLIAHRKYKLVEKLITHIDEKGRITNNMLGVLGMVDIAQGKFNSGLDRLHRIEKADYNFYIGLLQLQTKDIHDGVRALSVALKHETNTIRYKSGSLHLNFDEYGYPLLPLAHYALDKVENFGQSKEELQKHWEKWLEKSPYDITAIKALSRIYQQTLNNLPPKKERELYNTISNKYQLMQKRLKRYDLKYFK